VAYITEPIKVARWCQKQGQRNKSLRPAVWTVLGR